MSHEPTISSLVSTKVVKLPSWFTAGAALRVAKLKRVAHLLIEDRRQIVGSVSREHLETTAPDAPLGACMTATSASIEPSAPVHEAWARMLVNGVECLPVQQGALLVGLVSLQSVREAQLGLQDVA
jgi:signal-transduction protein with cAMP-binding, CBS, and nucleotidyltransferase domain